MDNRASTMSRQSIRLIAPTVPYVAVLIGMYVFSSAWASILLYHLGMAAVMVKEGYWSSLPLTATSRCRSLMILVGAGAGLIGPLLYLAWSTTKIAGLDLTAKLADLGLTDQWWILFMLYYFTVNPVLEEVHWRGYLGSAERSPVWSDLWFAGYHVLVIVKFVEPLWVVVGFAGLMGGAWLWRQIARSCESLAIPIVSHAIADASLIIAAGLLVS